jgi:1-phosphofructokinase family hexose kinase
VIATISLNPSIDFYFRVQKLHPEDTTRAETTRKMAGGKGLNVSRVLRRFGTKTKNFALLGGAAGNEYARMAGEAGIPLASVPVRGETRTNVVMFDRSEGSERRISGNAPSAGASEVRRLAKAVAAARPSIAVLTGALPAGIAHSVYADLTAQFARNGIRTVVDADGEALKRTVRARVKPFMIKPNEHELERLIGRPIRTPEAAARAALTLGAAGIRHVIASLGPQGAVFVHQGKRPFLIKPARIRIESRVAAGDSLVAGFLHALEKGDSPEQASVFALAAACASTAAPSGEFARLRATLRFIPKLKIQYLAQ